MRKGYAGLIQREESDNMWSKTKQILIERMADSLKNVSGTILKYIRQINVIGGVRHRLYMWMANAGFRQSSTIIFLKKRNIFTKM